MVVTPHNAPLVILAFLGAMSLLGLAGLAFVAAVAARRGRLAGGVLLGAVLVATLYGGTLIAYSASSQERVLPAGHTKYFCEMDCHVAYSVASVTTAQTLGEGEKAATANGVFYIVTVRSWFDEETISKRRARDLPLWPNPRLLYAFDDAGRRYTTSLAGQKAIVGSTVPLTHALQVGESYETTLVFDLPENSRQPRLLVQDWFPLSTLLIGHENSFGHKKTYFALDVPARAAK